MMGSTGEADRKRRHVSTISPTAAKRQPLVPLSEEKKVKNVVISINCQNLLDTYRSLIIFTGFIKISVGTLHECFTLFVGLLIIESAVDLG